MLKHLLRGGSGIQGDSWVVMLGGSGEYDYDYGRSVAIGPDGSVYVCVYQYHAGGNIVACLVAKFDSSGKLQFQKALGWSKNVYGQSVAVGLDGSVYVCGYTYIVENNSRYACLIAKLDSSGALQWGKKLYDPNNGSPDVSSNQVISVAIGPDGSVYVCGEINEDSTFTKYDCLIVKFNSSGTLQWQKNFDYSYESSVAIGSDDSVYICGTSARGAVSRYDLLIARITDADINQSTVVYGPFTWQDASVTIYNSALRSNPASLSVSTASLTIADANYISNKYEGE